MKIRVLKIIASPDFDALYPGAVVNLPDAQARALCEAGAAESLEQVVKDAPVEQLEEAAKEVKSKKKSGRGERNIERADLEER